MGKSSSPSAPDPYAAASAQYQYGTLGAAYNAALNNVDTQTPTGSTDWNVTGYSPTGAPEYQETSSLSQPEQQILGGSQGLADNAISEEQQTQQQGMPDVSQLTQYGNQAQQADYNVATEALNPEFSQEGEQLDASLRNSGAQPGTPAYTNAMAAFNSQMGSAYNSAENQAFGQGLESQSQLLGDVTQEQQTPINELEAIQGGTSVANPTGASGTGASVSAPDIMNAFNQQYQGQLNSYNASVGQSNALTGDAAALGSAALIAFSDERLKKQIEDLKLKTPGGVPVKRFRFKGEPNWAPKHVGVIAQDVEDHAPQAVGRGPGGFRTVDYARVP